MTQVTSLELSKELCEKGLKIETEKWWNQDTAYRYPILVNKPTGDWANFNMTKHNYIPAPSTDELLTVMPRNISIKQYDEKDSVRFQVEFDEGYMKPKEYEYNNSLPEALGQACVYLLTHGYRYNSETKVIEVIK